jgi:hypothetical protein
LFSFRKFSIVLNPISYFRQNLIHIIQLVTILNNPKKVQIFAKPLKRLFLLNSCLLKRTSVFALALYCLIRKRLHNMLIVKNIQPIRHIAILVSMFLFF